MNEDRLKKLFGAVRHEPAPEVPFGFSRQVVSAVRRESRQSVSPSLFDALAPLFPRLAPVLLIFICCVTLFGVFHVPEQDAGSVADFNQLVEHWFFDSGARNE